RPTDVVHHEAVQMPQHRAKGGAAFKLRHCFGINPIGHQGRADAVAGHVAHHDTQVIIPWSDQAEITADGSHWLIKSFHAAIAPNNTSRREALLHAGRE